MKRKVNLVGPSTLSITLPAKWCQRNSIRKGDELDVTEEGKTLAVAAGADERQHRTTTLDVRGLAPITRRAFDAIYKKGYDEVVVRYDKRDEIAPVLAAISDEAKSFEVVAQTKDALTIRSISELDQGEFDNLWRRTFLLLAQMADDVADAIAANDRTQLKDIVQLEATNNRFTHILRRALNRDGHPDVRNAMLLYTVTEQLEKAADELKYLCVHAATQKGKFRMQTVAFAKEVATFAHAFVGLFFGFSHDRAAKFSKEKHRLLPEGVALLHTGGADAAVIHHLLNFTQVCYDQVGPLVAMRY
jgi:phosphate uptake regulator